ncbi:ProQ/FINO family protein [Piscinibacter sakaiensis]|uniref:ProQ/FINO family protein n=1 Tax=Piscinibacter sakaiensis TaxID=1547922 RepID=UPI003AAF46B3
MAADFCCAGAPTARRSEADALATTIGFSVRLRSPRLAVPDIDPTPTDQPDSTAPAEANPPAEQATAAAVEPTPPDAAAEPAGSTAAPAPAAKPAIAELSPNACAARLAELFPAVFTAGAAKPLKLRIQADIQARAPGIFTRKSLSIFLHRHTTSTAYLKALTNSPTRFDLDGAPAGDVADEHREAARTELERRRATFESRRAAERETQRQQQRDAQQKAMQEFAAQNEARRDRAGLLRAFESSTLTPANFCALKGLTQEQLDTTLALARQEREQAPKPPPQQQQPRQQRTAPTEGQRRPPRGEGRPAGPPRRQRGGGRPD